MAGRVLIAEDLASNRILLRGRIAAAHLEAVFAEGAEDIVAAARRAGPDLVLVGLGAANRDGTGRIAALKAAAAGRALPVLALDPGTDRAVRLGALEAGADDAASLQDDPELLLARIRALLRARHHEADLDLGEGDPAGLGLAEAPAAFETAARIGLVTTDCATAEAWRAGLSRLMRDRIEAVRPDALFSGHAGAAAPDLCVIPTDLGGARAGLALIAELRSLGEARSAGILAVTPPGDARAGAAALDLGADAVMEAPLDMAEAALRLRGLFRRKAHVEGLRRRLSDGLRLAMTDPLTGLFNRRYALAHMARTARAAMVSGRPFAVMVLDLDRFKAVNDRFGHGAGDAVLVEAAQRIAGGLRSCDLIARLGGEEFLVVLPDTDAETARAVGERLRQRVEAEPFRLPGHGGRLSLTVSVGVAVAGGAGAAEAPDAALHALVDRADRALYAAKNDGRNQVAIALTAA